MGSRPNPPHRHHSRKWLDEEAEMMARTVYPDNGALRTEWCVEHQAWHHFTRDGVHGRADETGAGVHRG